MNLKQHPAQYWGARQNPVPSQGQGTNNPPNGGLLHATAATNPISISAGAGSGERHACRPETHKTHALLKRPHLTQHGAAAARSAHRHTPPRRQRGHATMHATGPVSAHRRGGMLRAAMCHVRARLAPVLCRSSFVVVAIRQWCTHMCVTTAVSSLFEPRLLVWRNPGELRGSLMAARNH